MRVPHRVGYRGQWATVPREQGLFTCWVVIPGDRRRDLSSAPGNRSQGATIPRDQGLAAFWAMVPVGGRRGLSTPRTQQNFCRGGRLTRRPLGEQLFTGWTVIPIYVRSQGYLERQWLTWMPDRCRSTMPTHDIGDDV